GRGRPEPLASIAGELGEGDPEGAGEEGRPTAFANTDSKQNDADQAEREAPDQHRVGMGICCVLRRRKPLQAVVNSLTVLILRHTMWAALHPTLWRFIDGPIHPKDLDRPTQCDRGSPRQRLEAQP